MQSLHAAEHSSSGCGLCVYEQVHERHMNTQPLPHAGMSSRVCRMTATLYDEGSVHVHHSDRPGCTAARCSGAHSAPPHLSTTQYPTHMHQSTPPTSAQCGHVAEHVFELAYIRSSDQTKVAGEGFRPDPGPQSEGKMPDMRCTPVTAVDYPA